jgi:hypothetical protein
MVVEILDECPYEVIVLATDGLGGAEINLHKCASLKTNTAEDYDAYQEPPLPTMGEQERPLPTSHQQ